MMPCRENGDYEQMPYRPRKLIAVLKRTNREGGPSRNRRYKPDVMNEGSATAYSVEEEGQGI